MVHRWWLSAIRTVFCALIVAHAAALRSRRIEMAHGRQKIGQRCGARSMTCCARNSRSTGIPTPSIATRGGFHQSMARDWSLEPDDNAFLVYQARMTWTAAAFARYSPRYRDELSLMPVTVSPSSTG